RVIPVGKVALEIAGGARGRPGRGAQVHARGLPNAINHRTDRSISRSGNIDPFEHIFHDLKAEIVIVAGPRRVEGFFQSVIQKVGLIDLKRGVPLFSAERADVSNVQGEVLDRKSTRLNSSHVSISYAVFC